MVKFSLVHNVYSVQLRRFFLAFATKRMYKLMFYFTFSGATIFTHNTWIVNFFHIRSIYIFFVLYVWSSVTMWSEWSLSFLSILIPCKTALLLTYFFFFFCIAIAYNFPCSLYELIIELHPFWPYSIRPSILQLSFSKYFHYSQTNYILHIWNQFELTKKRKRKMKRICLPVFCVESERVFIM